MIYHTHTKQLKSVAQESDKTVPSDQQYENCVNGTQADQVFHETGV